MSLETLVIRFGYPVIVIGLLFEGETVLVLGAFLAHRGYLNLPLVILLGWLVSFASDQFFFWMGRIKGSQFLATRPAWNPHVERAKLMLGRNTNLLFPSIRFMYGLRTVLPFVIGMSKVDPKRFIPMNLLGALLWALTFGLSGHFIGHLMTLLFEDVKEHELAIALAIIVVGLGIWLYRRNNNLAAAKLTDV